VEAIKSLSGPNEGMKNFSTPAPGDNWQTPQLDILQDQATQAMMPQDVQNQQQPPIPNFNVRDVFTQSEDSSIPEISQAVSGIQESSRSDLTTDKTGKLSSLQPAMPEGQSAPSSSLSSQDSFIPSGDLE